MPDRPLFVVQRHDATQLHYDLRLEVDGVLVSWAVPKGPTLDPTLRRLAVRVGDHDLSHATHEGRSIREVAAGRRIDTVIVWDTGTWQNVTRRRGISVGAAEAVEAGHLRFEVYAEKLTGQFALTRTAMGGNDRNWLLLKIDDEAAEHGPTASYDDRSVLTGRTNDDLAAGG